MSKLAIKGMIYIVLFKVIMILFIVDLAHGGIYEGFKHAKYRVFLAANEDYKGRDLDLRYTIDDIDLYRALFKNVFDVPEARISYNKNLTRGEFISRADSFKRSIRAGEVVVIVYAGHGHINGMPIFVDRKTLSPKDFFKFINSFKNDTVLIMDSCYSGAEGTKSTILNAASIESATADIPVLFADKEIKEEKGYRKNILRIYSSLSSQQSREADYRSVEKLKKHLGKTYSFLDNIGYKSKGNGIFSILIASFFSEISLKRRNYTYDSLGSYINTKVTLMGNEGYINQRPKIVPFGSPFKNRSNYFLLYKDFQEVVKDSREAKLYNLGFAKEREGKYRQALKYYEAIYNENPDYVGIKGRISECFLQIGIGYKETDTETHVRFLRRALKFNPKSTFVLSSLAQAEVSQGKYEEGLKIFEKILEQAKDYKLTWLKANTNINIGYVYYVTEQVSQAIKYFESGLNDSIKIKDYQGQVLARNYLGTLYLNQGDRQSAFKEFEEVERLSRKTGDKVGESSAQNNKGFVFMGDRKYELALKEFLKSYEIQKGLRGDSAQRIKILNNLGFVYGKLGRYKEAERYYKLSAESYGGGRIKDKSMVGIYINLSDMYTKQRKYKEALKVLDEAELLLKEEDRADTIKILLSRGNVMFRSGKFKSAERLYQRARQLSEVGGDVKGAVYASIDLSLVYEAWIKEYLNRKEYADALLILGKVLVIYKELENRASIGITYANIGYVYYKEKDYEKALEFFYKGLRYYRRGDIGAIELIPQYINTILLKLGYASTEDREYKEAISSFSKALEISRGVRDNKGAGNASTGLAGVYGELKDRKNMLKYYKLSLNFFLLSKDEDGIIRTYYSLGVYYHSNDVLKSYDNFKNAYYYLNGKPKHRLYNMVVSNMLNSGNLLAGNLLKAKKYKLSILYYKEVLSNLKTLRGGGKYDKLRISLLKGLIISYRRQGSSKEAKQYERELMKYLKKKKG